MSDIPWGDLIPFLAFGVVVADASVAIRGDLSGFHRDLGQTEKVTGGFVGRMKNLLSPKNIITGAGILGIGLGLQQIVSRIGDVISEYSELKQSQQTVDDVFGRSAGIIEDWADRAAEAAGLSEREVSKSAATMGTMLQNMGVDAETAADTVVTLQQRAADLATAFPGKTTEDAMLAFSAALRGERDTVEKFGVTLTQAMIDARIETENLDTSTPAAERYATAIATLGLIMDQTAASAGRYEEALESGDTDAVATSLGARIENANAGLVKNLEDTVNEVAELGDDVGDFFDNIFNPEKQAKQQQLADLWGVTFNQAGDRIQEAADRAGVEWEEQLAYMTRTTNTTIDDLAESGKKTSRSFAGGLEEEQLHLEGVADETLRDPVLQSMLDAEENAGKSGLQVVIEYAKGLLTPQTDVEVAIQTALQVVEDEMSATEEVAYLAGQKTMLEEARGIASQEGKDASVIAIDAALQIIEDRLNQLSKDAYNYGVNFTEEYAAGIVNNLGVVKDAAHQLGGALAGKAAINSEPTDHTSPLYGITKWGGNIVKTIAEGIYGELGTGSSAAAALAGALVPSVPGGGVMGMTTAGSGGNTYVLHVNGVPIQVSSAEEMVEQLIDLGVMTEGRLA